MVRDLSDQRWFPRWQLSEEMLIAALSTDPPPSFPQAIETIFASYAATKEKGRWGDKTPSYANDVGLLAEIFPTARFVHLVRDGRDVAAVSKARFSASPRSTAHLWSRRVRSVWTEIPTLRDRYHQLSYEHLVRQPRGTLVDLCRFLDLDFEEVMLHPERRATVIQQQVPVGRGPRDGLPPTAGLRDWRRELTPREVRGFEAIAGRELEEAGYELAGRVSLGSRSTAWFALGVASAYRRMAPRRARSARSGYFVVRAQLERTRPAPHPRNSGEDG